MLESNSKFQTITEKYSSLPWMNIDQAEYMRKLILGNKFSKLCELGHLHGKSSIYLASILEDQGFGHLWTFDRTSTRMTPNIDFLLEEFNLNDYVTTVVSDEGFHWDLYDLKMQNNQTFDFCYIDGEHTFDGTTTAFFLVDSMLDQNGIVIFDDYSWTVELSIKNLGPSILNIPVYSRMTEKQRQVSHVKMLCDIIDTNRYELLDLNANLGWAVYRKK